jgi:ABC-type polysaccharide/polyol phosphate export permease
MNLDDIIIDIFIILWLILVLFWYPPDWDWARYTLLNIILFVVAFVIALWSEFFGASGPQ